MRRREPDAGGKTQHAEQKILDQQLARDHAAPRAQRHAQRHLRTAAERARQQELGDD